MFGPHLVLRFLKLFRKLLVGSSAVKKALVDMAADFCQRTRRLHERLHQRRDIFGQRRATCHRALGELRLGIL